MEQSSSSSLAAAVVRKMRRWKMQMRAVLMSWLHCQSQRKEGGILCAAATWQQWQGGVQVEDADAGSADEAGALPLAAAAMSHYLVKSVAFLL
jgi:hypothetical protein